MKTTPRPSSPTSLLWAHQLKREHGHLIGRLQQVESANRQQEDRIKKAESAAKAGTNNDIAALADQVKALDEGGINKRLAKVEKDVMAKLDDVQAESEAMVLKVASLEKDDVLVEEERRKAFNKEKALLKRVGEVEESLKLYEAGLESVGRRVDDASISTIKAQLDSLVGQVRKEGAEMKRLEDSISVLEAANEELRKANERLAAEMEKVAAKPTLTPLVQTVVEAAADEAASPEDVTEQPELEDDGTPKRRKKKSHKWAGGGADRDIIRQASDVVHKVAAPPRRTLTPKAVAKPKAIAKPKEVSKKGVATKEVAKPARKSQGFLDGDADKPIIRAGKGWVEVAMTPSQSEQESQESRYALTRYADYTNHILTQSQRQATSRQATQATTTRYSRRSGSRYSTCNQRRPAVTRTGQDCSTETQTGARGSSSRHAEVPTKRRDEASQSCTEQGRNEEERAICHLFAYLFASITTTTT